MELTHLRRNGRQRLDQALEPVAYRGMDSEAAPSQSLHTLGVVRNAFFAAYKLKPKHFVPMHIHYYHEPEITPPIGSVHPHDNVLML